MRTFACLFMLSVGCSAATYNAATCNLSDVQTAINNEIASAADGDIINIPSGNCTWTGTTQVTGTFTKNVTVQGAGAISSTAGGSGTSGSDVTIITDNVNHASLGSSMQLTTPAGKSLRVTGIAIITNSSSSVAAEGLLQIEGGSSALRVDHCHFFLNGTGYVGLYVGGSLTGVLDHIFFDATTGSLTNDLAIHNGSTWNNNSLDYGDGSWTDTEHWGTGQFIFIEDTRFHNGDMGDGHDGARYVLRHSTMVCDAVTGFEGQFFNHGLTSARGRGVRAVEIYADTFTQPGTTGANQPAYSLNSGTMLFWGNTITQYREAVTIDYTRKNNGTYGYGTTPTGWGNCDSGSSIRTNWDGPTTGYPCMDAGGRGAGDLLVGDYDTNGQLTNVKNNATGSISFAQQVLSPIYVFNNSFTPAGGYSPVNLVGNSYDGYTDNVDYYQQFGTNAEPGSFNGTAGVGQGSFSAITSTCTVGVGYWATDQTALYVCNPTNTWSVYYTPYTYPHPLTQTIVIAGTGVGGKNQITGKTVIQ